MKRALRQAAAQLLRIAAELPADPDVPEWPDDVDSPHRADYEDGTLKSKQALELVFLFAVSGHVRQVAYLVDNHDITKRDVLSDDNATMDAVWTKAVYGHVGLLAKVAENGHVDVLRFFREQWGFSDDDARGGDNVALFCAARMGRVATLQYLRDGFGLTTDDARARFNAALISAAKRGHVDVLRCLRENFGLTADDARADDAVALWVSVKRGHVDVVRYLHEGFGLRAEDAGGNSECRKGALEASLRNLPMLRLLKVCFGVTKDDLHGISITLGDVAATNVLQVFYGQS